jgi:hypothetical protein
MQPSHFSDPFRAEAGAVRRRVGRHGPAVSTAARNDETVVTAFLASAVAGGRSEVIGEPYEDGSANSYLSMFRQPVLVYAAGADALVKARTKAVARASPLRFTEELFKTGNDDDNRAAVRAVPAGELRLVGLAVYGPRNDVDRVLKGLSLHTPDFAMPFGWSGRSQPGDLF